MTVSTDEIVGELARRGLDFFTIDDLVDRLGLTREQAGLVAHRLAAKHRVRRLKRGLYAALEPAYWNRPDAGFVANWYLAAAHLAAPYPYYLAYYTAMELHRMLQHPLTSVYVATTRQRQAVRAGPATFRFVTLSPHRFFGDEGRQVERGKEIRVADLERTFLDATDRMDLCGGFEEVVRGLDRRHEDIDRDRLLRHVDRLGRDTTARRMGFLLDEIGHDDPRLLSELRSLVGRAKNYTPLDPAGPRTGVQRDPRWQVIVNAPIERALEGRRT